MLAPIQSDYATDSAWFDALREYTNPRVLAMLAANNGAMLCWQVPILADDGDDAAQWEPAHAFDSAFSDGTIAFDSDYDLYLHPDAIQVSEGGYTMPEGQS